MENPGVLPGFILGGCFEAEIKLSELTNPPKMSHQSTNCVADPAKQKTSRNPYPASFEASSYFNSFFREMQN